MNAFTLLSIWPESPAFDFLADSQHGKYNGVQSKEPFYQFMMKNEVILREQKWPLKSARILIFGIPLQKV